MATSNDDLASRLLTRRRALGLLAGTTATLALGCGSSEASNAPIDAATGDAGPLDATTTGDAGACTATPEGEIGPYFADDSDPRFNRSNLLTNLDGSSAQAGISLTLTVVVRDAMNGCAPYANAQVDVWHCNPQGIYSDQAAESTTTQQWLRGYQVTDANGQVTFVTVIPGWYSGRTTHIHLRIRSTYSDASSTTDGTNATQLFFPQTFVDRLATSVAPYDAEGTNPTTNAGDRVYSQQQHGVDELTLTGDDTTGYTATVTIYLPITATATTTDGGAPPEGGMGAAP